MVVSSIATNYCKMDGMKKKPLTAVQWLINNMPHHVIEMFNDYYPELLVAAKAMEKEQIIEAAQYEPWLGNMSRKTGENYYNEKYQNNNNP